MSIQKTISIVGSAREWVGTFEQYEEHGEIVDHWVEGGDVDMFAFGSWVPLTCESPDFFIDTNYRKKQREPKAGEVWQIGNYLCICCDTLGKMKFYRITGDQRFSVDVSEKKYLAPSIEAYFARKFLNSNAPASWKPIDVTLSMKAARDDN